VMEISPTNVSEFLTRFQNFDDALIRSIHFSFVRQQDERPSSIKRGVVVLLSVQDQTSSRDEGWVNVRLDIEAVSEFHFAEGERTTHVVLSQGLSVRFFDGKVYLAPDAETETLEEFRASELLIAGERCTWTVSDYKDSE
jgi:hypothetical protein